MNRVAALAATFAALAAAWPLHAQESPDDRAIHLAAGLEVRMRSESAEGLEWGQAAVPDQGNLWLRALPYAELRVAQLRIFVQPIAGLAVGVGPSPSPVDRTGLDMLQAFVDDAIDLGPAARLRIKAGRQLVGLGSERLVGTRYGANTPLAFDGARATVEHGRMTADLFYLVPVEAGARSFDDRRAHGKALAGLYATRWFDTDRQDRLDLYYLRLNDDRRSFQQGAGREIRHTFGLRSAGSTRGFHWDAEAMFQFGHFDRAPVHAWSLAVLVGRRFAAMALKPDISMHVDIVSGDRNAADPRLQAFDPLFPKAKYFGELSPIGPYNIIDIHPTLTLDLGDNLTFAAAAMAYWRQSGGDGVYDVPGHLIRAGKPTQARFIGRQVELKAEWQATPAFNLSGSVGHFSPGPFLRESGARRPIDVAALEANFRF